MKKKILLMFRSALIILFLLSSLQLFPDSFSDAENNLTNGHIDKALSVFYDITEDEKSGEMRIYLSMKYIIEYEEDLSRINKNLNNNINKLHNKKYRAELFYLFAVISELCGRNEDAVRYYKNSYNELPDNDNIKALINTSRIMIDNGQLDESLELLEMLSGTKTEKEISDKIVILRSLIIIISGKPDTGTDILEDLIQRKDLSENNILSIMIISKKYNLDKILKISENILKERNYAEQSDFLSNSERLITPTTFFYDFEPDLSEKNNESGIDNIFIQTGSYSSENNASNMIKRLEKIGLTGHISESLFKGNKIYKVLINAGSKEEAEKINIVLKENSIESFLIFQ